MEHDYKIERALVIIFLSIFWGFISMSIFNVKAVAFLGIPVIYTLVNYAFDNKKEEDTVALLKRQKEKP